MARKLLFLSLAGIFFSLVSPIFLPVPITIRTQAAALDKVKFGTSVKDHPAFYLPILAAEDKGFWKDQGLEVDWVPFTGAATLLRAVAAEAISMGMSGPVALVPAAARGVPVVIVANHNPTSEFLLLVRAESPYKEPKDLKGTKIGVLTLGAATHAYARVIAKAAGIEKEVKFVGTGGLVETIAALRVKAVDAIVLNFPPLVPLILAGEARELVALADYLPKGWMDQVVFTRKELIRDKPEVVKRVIKAVLQGNNFVLTNRAWTMEKMKAMSGFSEEAAAAVFSRLALSRTGKIERPAMENIRNFLLEYELVPKDKAPPLEEIYTTKFTD